MVTGKHENEGDLRERGQSKTTSSGVAQSPKGKPAIFAWTSAAVLLFLLEALIFTGLGG